MPVDIRMVRHYLKDVMKMMLALRREIERSPKGMSRRNSRLQHNATVVTLLAELQEIVQADPEFWEDEEENVPF